MDSKETTPAVTPGEAQPVAIIGWQPGSVVFSEYRVKRVLGTGQSGDVHLVESLITQREFAAKHFRPEIYGPTESSRKRFLAELTIWIDLPQHPFLIPCYFFRTADDSVALFSEYADGSLHAYVSQSGALSGPEAIDMAIQLASGLSVLHRAGVVHGDLKPENVLRRDGVFKISDFGISHRTSARESGAKGTLAYRAPEQERNEATVPATDVWGLALIVLFAAAGRRFWSRGPDGDAILAGAAEIGHPPPVLDLLRRCLAPSPDERPDADTIVRQLVEMYANVTGRKYPRELPVVTATSRAAGEEGFSVPVEWLGNVEAPLGLGSGMWVTKAFTAAVSVGHPAGDDPRKALDGFVYQNPEAPQGGPTALADYERAALIYEEVLEFQGEKASQLPAEERHRRRAEIASLYWEISMVHASAGDFGGALNVVRRGLAHSRKLGDEGANLRANLERTEKELLLRSGQRDELLRHQPSQSEPMSSLADILSLRMQATALLEVGRAREADVAMARVIEEMQKRASDSLHAGFELANTYDEYSQLQRAMRRHEEALRHSDAAVKMYATLDPKNEEPLVLFHSSLAYRNLAIVRGELGDLAGAVEAYDESIKRLTRLAEGKHASLCDDELASCYMSKGITLSQHDRAAEALDAYDRAIALREQLVLYGGRSDLAPKLARVYTNKAVVLGKRDEAAALELRAKAYTFLVQMVATQERGDLMPELMSNLAAVGQSVARNGQAVREFLGPVLAFSDSIIADEEQLLPTRVSFARIQLVSLMHLAQSAAESLPEAERIEMFEAILAICRRYTEQLATNFPDVEANALVVLFGLVCVAGDWKRGKALAEEAIAACAHVDDAAVRAHLLVKSHSALGLAAKHADEAGWPSHFDCALAAGKAVPSDERSEELLQEMARSLLFAVGGLDDELCLALLDRNDDLLEALITGDRIRTLLGEYIALRRTHIRCMNDRGRQKEARSLSKRVEKTLGAFADETQHPDVQKAHAQFRADHAQLLR